MNKITVRVLRAMPGLPVGKECEIEVTADDTPVSRRWRRRLQIANYDQSLEIVGADRATLDVAETAVPEIPVALPDEELNDDND